jgi:hypothetical protein
VKRLIATARYFLMLIPLWLVLPPNSVAVEISPVSDARLASQLSGQGDRADRNGTGGFVDAVMVAAIGPYRKSR